MISIPLEFIGMIKYYIHMLITIVKESYQSITAKLATGRDLESQIDKILGNILQIKMHLSILNFI
jgi:hypothetical protein